MRDEWGRINETMIAATKMDYGIDRLKGKRNNLCKINKSNYKISKREGCKQYHVLEEIFSGTTATKGLGNASAQLSATSKKEMRLEDDFLNRRVHVRVENNDEVDEVSNTR
ncbi:Uncharacterized protein Adt_13395 [Abeliophyllum distichum]|uniref:Uncharacterized protein n=1 Tax=Abeliophyllum distichum TaxID=126358 RepID=A0ABD1TX56_9LAMI